MRFLGSRRRTDSSPPQRPPPGPRSRKTGHFIRSPTLRHHRSSSPRLAVSAEFSEARQRWSELARERRSGLCIASDELDNAAASIDSINIIDPGVRHVCTPPQSSPSDYLHSTSVIAPSATSESESSVPSATPSPNSIPIPRSTFHNDQDTPITSPAASRPSLSDSGNSPYPSNFKVDYAELTALKQKFRQLDIEKKGFLSRSQFYELFSSMMDSNASGPNQNPMFNFAYSLFHAAGDRLNIKEFVTGMSVLSKGSEEDRLRYLFSMYDKDGSGNLNADEIKQVFRVMGSFAASHDYRASESLDSQSLSSLRAVTPSVLDDLARKTVQQYDHDGDGKIAFDEFAEWCKKDPVVKTWMDTLCYDTARGVARLRGESEKELVAQELGSLGIVENHFWRDNFNLAPGIGSGSTSASHGALLPPTMSSQMHLPPNAIVQSDSSGEFDRPPRKYGSPGPFGEFGESESGATMESADRFERRGSHTRTMTQTAIGSFEIDFRSLIFEKQIGCGSFAVVWKCRWLDSPVAVKVFKSGPRLVINADGSPSVTASSQLTSSSDINSSNCDRGFTENGESFEPEFDSMMSGRDSGIHQSMGGDELTAEMATNRVRFLQEVSLLKSIRHPNLLLYMGACVDPNFPLCIVSELIDGGSLFELLHGRDRVPLSIRQKLLLTQDIARGMLYLHGRDPIVLHRDLKSANILVELQNDDSFKGTIIDFGLSKFSSTQASIIPGRGRGLTGSLVTMAPEVMNEQKYEPRSDVYSYAIVCWEIWCGRIPFGKLTGPTQLLMKVAVQGARPEFEREDNVPPAIQSLIRACWDQDIRNRPDFLMIVKTLNEIRHELNLSAS